jgi:hypothetical protein
MHDDAGVVNLRLMRALPAFALALPLLLPARAAAQDVEPRATSESTRGSWYGWQTLVSDGVTIGLFVTANRTHSSGLGVAGLVTYWIGPAVVHTAHGHGVRAIGSVALRTAPLLLAIPASHEEEGGEGNNGHAGAATVLFVLSVPLVIAADAASAFDEKPAVHRPPPPDMGFAPDVKHRGIVLWRRF